jgi:hypothetical protein
VSVALTNTLPAPIYVILKQKAQLSQTKLLTKRNSEILNVWLIKKTEAVIKNLPTKITSGLDGFTNIFYPDVSQNIP